MSQLGLEPRRVQQEEEGKWVMFGELVKLSWPVWRLPPLLWLAWPPQDHLSKHGTLTA